jgi:hypothetical protein
VEHRRGQRAEDAERPGGGQRRAQVPSQYKLPALQLAFVARTSTDNETVYIPLAGVGCT